MGFIAFFKWALKNPGGSFCVAFNYMYPVKTFTRLSFFLLIDSNLAFL